MKGFILLLACCLAGCMTIRAERFEKDAPKTQAQPAARVVSKTLPTAKENPPAEAPPEPRAETQPDPEPQTEPVAISEPPKPDPTAYIATLTEGSGGMVQQLGIKGDWQLLTWTNGFQILVAASSNYTEGTPWYRIVVIKDGRIEYHDQIMVDPTAEDYEGVNNCDSFSPAIQALNGPVIAIGLECYNQGGDNNYATDHVLIFRVERPPTSMDDFTLLERIKASPIVSGYYENSWTKTTLEVRGTEIWRTDVVTVGVSVEEEMQGIERESVVTTTSEKVLDF
jgi:hypothetical protein